jgi:hypothetical protein
MDANETFGAGTHLKKKFGNSMQKRVVTFTTVPYPVVGKHFQTTHFFEKIIFRLLALRNINQDLGN